MFQDANPAHRAHFLRRKSHPTPASWTANEPRIALFALEFSSVAFQLSPEKVVHKSDAIGPQMDIETSIKAAASESNPILSALWVANTNQASRRSETFSGESSIHLTEEKLWC